MRFICCIALLLLASCAGDYVQASFTPAPGVTQEEPDSSASQRSNAIKVLDAFPNEGYTVLGTVRITGNYRNGDEEYISRLKLEAARVGADAVVVQRHLTGMLRHTPFGPDGEVIGTAIKTKDHAAHMKATQMASKELETFNTQGPTLREILRMRSRYARW
ncbi:MAG: hypothetical protein J0L97_02765 [Alphaproteobacteria bacterium]|nr:hypothetical protein [Alphaproteobacteria bacterium]